MRKKVLIVGNSATGYALAKKMSEKHDIFIMPASDTLKEFANCLDIRENSVQEILEFVLENGIDLTIPLSESTLQTDIVPAFVEHKLQIFAPSKEASKIVFDKAYAKKTMYKLRIPTPKFGIFEKEDNDE